MRWSKRIIESGPGRKLLFWLGAQYIRLVYRTSRWTVVSADVPRRLWDRGEPFIGCLWHGRIMMMPYCWDRREKVRVLVSRHRDGQLIGGVVRRFGAEIIEGSTSKGGAVALRSVLRALEARYCVALTPDGPRGPRMRMSPGAVEAARRTGAPIVTASYSTTRRRLLGTWDRFLVPLPFGRGVFVFGEPIRVPGDADDEMLEAARLAVEDRLNQVTREADRLCGWPAVEPAPPPASAPKAGATAAGGSR